MIVSKKAFLIFIILVSCVCFAQNEANIWYFGQNAGLDFNSGTPVALTNGQLNTDEGCATLCDSNGQLLFYTDGITVYNKNHQIMPNGNGLFGHTSSTQSATIVNKPGSTNLYYIFTIDAEFPVYGLRYSIVDINLNGGLGDVTASKNILVDANVSEKFGVVKQSGANAFWIVSIVPNSNQFVAYSLSATGVSPTPVTSFSGLPIGTYSKGYLKFSHAGNKLVMCDDGQLGAVQLYDFNGVTGIISNSLTLGTNGSFYGAEFSPDGNLLYVSEATNSTIHQFNLNASNIPSSMIDFDSNINFMFYGALQLGPDSKIYIAQSESNKLGVINNPNVIGIGSNIQPDAIDLGGKMSHIGLPAFNQSIFFDIKILADNSVCINDSISFSYSGNGLANPVWDFGDGSPTSNLPNPTHQYTVAGEYNVTLTLNNGEFVVSKKIVVVPIPSAFSINTTLTTTCDDEPNPMSQDGLFAFNTSTFQSTILGSQTGMIVKYYDESNNPLSSPLPNPFNTRTQNVRVEVINPINQTCKATTTIPFVVNPVPKISLNGNEIVCNELTLNKTIDADILDGTPTSDYAYTWKKDGILLPTETNYSLNVNQAGIYTVEVKNSVGCTRTRTINVVASDLATITNVQVTDLSDSNSIIVSVTGNGNYVYSLDNIEFQESNAFYNLPAGVYIVYVKDLNGCGISQEEVSVLGIPKYFTPNGDGYHDYWNIKGITTNFANSKIYIFDRLGKLLKEISPLDKGWDGTYLGNKLPATDYWYSISLTDGRILKGHFTLKR